MGIFERRELKLVLYVAGAAVVIAVILTVLLSGDGSRKNKGSETETVTYRIPIEEIDPGDLIIPREFTEVWRRDWVPYREQKEVWTREDTEPYWSDTKEVLLEVLEKQTVESLMRNLSPSETKNGKEAKRQ